MSKTDCAGRLMTEARQRNIDAIKKKDWRRRVSKAKTKSDTEFFESLTEIDRAPIRHAREAFTSEFEHRMGYA